MRRLMISSQNLRVSWKPVNPQDCVWRNLYRITMRTILQEKETIHYNIAKLLHKFYSSASSNEDTRSKSSRIKNGRNLKRFRRGTWQKSEVNQRWSMTQGQRAEKFILPTDGPLSFEECRIWDKASKIQRSSSTPRRHCERWFLILCSIYLTRIISITNDCSESHGHHIQTVRMRRTSSWRSICLNPGQNGRCSEILEIPKSGMFRH